MFCYVVAIDMLMWALVCFEV